MRRRSRVTAVVAALGLAGGTIAAGLSAGAASGSDGHGATAASLATTATPIKHLVVIFDENVSFDHYFGTYPYATNPLGEPSFTAAPTTPTVNGLYNSVSANGTLDGPLLDHNGNTSNPMRLDRSDPMTCDQDHNDTTEQKAADHGAEDLYAQDTGHTLSLNQCLAGQKLNGAPEAVPPGATANRAVMDYYDGNTVTALWNYAQQYAMSDNAYGTTYGPSTPGALNVTSAQTYGAICGPASATLDDAPCTAPPGYTATNVTASDLTTATASRSPGTGTTYSDADPYFDACSYLPKADGGDGRLPATTIEMGGKNIGDELSSANLTWGWFEGGFDNGYVPGKGTAPATSQICSQEHKNVGGTTVVDYIPHHDPFQYYASTANPMHLPPTSVSMVGHNDQANHNYDMADFWAAADEGNMPAVSYLKAPAYQDGHAGYSDPLDEQQWLVDTIDHLQSLPSWSSTAVVVTWDDSDGWYDHVLAPVVTASHSAKDALTATGACGPTPLVPLTTTGAPEQGKCGLGPRLPFLVISPYAKNNFVDHTLIDQSSVVKFIEYNWDLPALGNGAADTAAGSILSMFAFSHPANQRLFLDDTTGEPLSPSNGQGQGDQGHGHQGQEGSGH